MIYLETERLILRDYTDADFEAYYCLKNGPGFLFLSH